jgi:hypothetical protein
VSLHRGKYGNLLVKYRFIPYYAVTTNAGDKMPAKETLIRDVEWIMTGKWPSAKEKGNEAASVNIDELWMIILEIEVCLSEKTMVLDPTKKARLIAVLYESANSGKKVTKEIVNNYLFLLT